VGTCALLCESAGPLDIEHQRRIWALTEEVSTWEAVLEVLPCLNNLMVVFDPFKTDIEVLEKDLVDAWIECDAQHVEGKLVEIPVVYGENSAWIFVRQRNTLTCPSSNLSACMQPRNTWSTLSAVIPGLHIWGSQSETLYSTTERTPSACEGGLCSDRWLSN
jgi:allophanate hydrolase subunit 1